MILKSNGYNKLNLDLSKGRRMEKTHFQLREDELLLYSISKNSVVADRSTRLVGIADRLGDSPIIYADCSFLRQVDPLPSGLNVLEQKAKCFPLVTHQVCLAKLRLHATQDSFLNIHNRTQTTNAKINCVLKDSSCDTPLPKILKPALLASNVSSISTKAFECPHTNDDSIFTHKWIINLSSGIRCNAHTKKEEHNAYFHP
ncbi:hypothetical protein H5410_046230 [Solanum commersonii]|uniref:Uncharacterized protein n=1 Tax=Solanum commersonii TaxID=4109 RepID=A0A9J5XEY9_SOLCO|nr:hypothetical protein H5410_046230 [Solanum commersonii]